MKARLPLIAGSLALSVLIITLFIWWPSRPASAAQRSPEQDRKALLALEDEWLKHEHDGPTLERILASDFVHPVSTGDMLTREQHIFYSTKYPPPAGIKQRFANLQVRVYGDVGIVNGIVVTTGPPTQQPSQSIFTDVFVFRDGRWQAVNAQEGQVEARRPLPLPARPN